MMTPNSSSGIHSKDNRRRLNSIGSFLARRPVLTCVILGACISIPCTFLNNGFFADDFLQLSELQTRPGLIKHLFDLFAFFDGNRDHIHQSMNIGFLPWFTHPELKISFWRPLSALLQELDFELSSIDPMPAKIHSVLWYLSLIAAVGVLFRRTLPQDLVLLSLIIFTLAPTHREPVEWIAARNALVTATLGIVALSFHIRWRLDRWRLGRFLSIVFLVLAFLGGEAGFGVMPYFLAFEYFQSNGSGRDRLQAVAPAITASVLWLAIYYLLGYGTHGGVGYQNPVLQQLRCDLALNTNT